MKETVVAYLWLLSPIDPPLRRVTLFRILAGTTIISDFWKAYDGLSEIYNHLKINYSITFRNKETSVHTSSVEGTWRADKDCVPYGRNWMTSLSENITRYMFIKHCKAMGIPVEIGFFQLAGSLHNFLHLNPVLKSEEIDVYSEYEVIFTDLLRTL